MSLVDEDRSETRMCDVCKAKHTSRMSYDGQVAKRIDYPWRVVEMIDARNFHGAPTMHLDICSSACVLVWMKLQIHEHSESFHSVRVELREQEKS